MDFTVSIVRTECTQMKIASNARINKRFDLSLFLIPNEYSNSIPTEPSDLPFSDSPCRITKSLPFMKFCFPVLLMREEDQMMR